MRSATSLLSGGILGILIFIGVLVLYIYVFVLFLKLARRGIKALDIYISKNHYQTPERPIQSQQIKSDANKNEDQQ